MAEREYNEEIQELKKSEEKRKLSREMIKKKRILFANPLVEKVGQPNEAPEDIEVEEGPREKGRLDLSIHKTRRK